ncbi:hypothetical protein ACVGVM_21550 [Pseudonocardia bannensis]|uniref:Uncharacterized protein n=1 Tax=Pseudonocardia bannensis TaxID=630973 RepID=A0A848DH36_9PSEU|nr:hypothetical protein [Pseudonocardia bannensis]NMH91831.1 hypothetical protein [Pseudonocardia bannensis]
MTTESSRTDNLEEEDRVVSRRVDHGTTASDEDRRAYRAADPAAGTGPAEPGSPVQPDDRAATSTRTDGEQSGGTTERAGRELADDDDSEPSRSE